MEKFAHPWYLRQASDEINVRAVLWTLHWIGVLIYGSTILGG